ncbi:MAG: RluA family pseudouridine synthase [Bacteroidetes bacterium]|nr:RluA family pseudouridine synthase [Bacteroidota bacterium]
MKQPEIIFENYYLAVLHKPAGLMVEDDGFGNPSVQQWMLQYLQKKYPDHKTYYIGFPHRLDRVTEGLLLIAKTKAALTSLGQQFESRSVRKLYHALVGQSPRHTSGVMRHYLKKDVKQKKAIISQKSKEGFSLCELKYEAVATDLSNCKLLKIELLTGRYHQIRAQLAFEKNPIVGDKFYGSAIDTGNEKIALAATELLFHHPKTNEPMVFELEWKKVFSVFLRNYCR